MRTLTVDIHKNDKGKTVDDVNFNSCHPKFFLIIPLAGSVDVMIICILCDNFAFSFYGEDIIKVCEKSITQCQEIDKRV